MKKIAFILLVCLPFLGFSQSTLTLSPSQDNTIADANPENSNGAGSHCFVGVTQNGKTFRSLLKFEPSSVPEGATLTTVTLSLNMSKSTSGTADVTLHKLSADWGEGTSDASANEGSLAAATANDVTWNDRFFGSEQWSNAGGDFASEGSATTSISGVGRYTWTSEQMLNDLKSWLESPEGNFGWIILGDETGGTTSKRFDTRENANEANRPVLTITYEVTSDNNDPSVSDASFTVAENSSSGTQVGTVTASDPDGDDLAFSITDGNDGNPFAIDATSGQITVNQSGPLDFETTPSFELTVTVNDGNGGSAAATITINLTDVDESANTDPEMSGQNFSIEENSTVGTEVGTVEASDIDGDNLTFSIVDGNDGNPFAIDAASGQITVNQSGSLDFETTPSFELTVTVNDGNGGSASATVTISLTDVDEQPTLSVSSEVVLEVYPNPAWDMVYVRVSGQTGGMVSFSIYDLSGQVVRFRQGVDSREAQLSIEGLRPGVYYASVSFPTQTITKRIVVR